MLLSKALNFIETLASLITLNAAISLYTQTKKQPPEHMQAAGIVVSCPNYMCITIQTCTH